MSRKTKTKPCNCEIHNGQEVPLRDFVKHKGHPDGYSDLCKTAFNKKYNIKPKEDIHKKLDLIIQGIEDIKNGKRNS